MCPVLVQHHRALGKHQLNPVRGGPEHTELSHPAGRVRAHPPSPGLEHGPIPAGKAQGQEPGPGSPSLTPSNQGDNSALPFAFNLKFFSSPCCRREGKHPRPPLERGKGQRAHAAIVQGSRVTPGHSRLPKNTPGRPLRRRTPPVLLPSTPAGTDAINQ